MKYTIDIQRVVGKNVVDDLLVLITEDHNEYLKAWQNLTLMFEHNKTFVKSAEYKNEDITRLYLTYDFQREW